MEILIISVIGIGLLGFFIVLPVVLYLMLRALLESSVPSMVQSLSKGLEIKLERKEQALKLAQAHEKEMHLLQRETKRILEEQEAHRKMILHEKEMTELSQRLLNVESMAKVQQLNNRSR